MDNRKWKNVVYLRVIIILLLLVAGINAGMGKTGPAQKKYSVDLGNDTQLDMVWIHAGSFLMGSPETEEGWGDDKGIQTEIALEGYWIGKYEVTQAQYMAVMGTNPSHFKGDNNPVEEVNWNDAMEFCRKLSEKTGKNFILPTEAQWEYACRAGTTTAYSFGDDATQLGDYAWWGGNADTTTHPIGEKRPNKWGLYDMHGNVSEWCLSLYKPYHYSETDGRNSLLPPSNKNRDINSFRPDTSNERVLRGGSWNNDFPSVFCCAFRSYSYPDARQLRGYGFRCVRTLQ